MKDLNTVDYRFNFNQGTGATLKTFEKVVAVWAHQDVLKNHGRFRANDGIATHMDTTKGDRQYKIQTMLDNKYTLLATCVVLRYIYTGELTDRVDLREHVITPGKTNSPQHVGHQIDPLVISVLANAVQTANWNQVIEIAESWRMEELAQICRGHLNN